MEISKSQLQKALEIVKPGLSNKDVIEQASSFAFMGDRVVTYNDDISISHPIGVEGLELKGAIKAEKLYQFLSKIKVDTIDIAIEGNEVRIRAGRSKAGLLLEQEIKLPLEEETSYKEKWKTLPTQFVESVELAIPSCSKKEARPKLTCVHLRQDGIVEASDDLQIMQVTMQDPMPVENFLLPYQAAIVVCRLKPTKIAKGRGWIHFKTQVGTIVSCRILADQYMVTSRAFVFNETQSLVFPDKMGELLERANIFAKRDHMLDETVQVTIANNRLKIRGEGDSGWFEESVRATYEGEEISFFIAPYLLKNILKQKLEVVFTSNRLKFEGPNWVYVTLLKEKVK